MVINISDSYLGDFSFVPKRKYIIIIDCPIVMYSIKLPVWIGIWDHHLRSPHYSTILLPYFKDVSEESFNDSNHPTFQTNFIQCSARVNIGYSYITLWNIHENIVAISWNIDTIWSIYFACIMHIHMHYMNLLVLLHTRADLSHKHLFNMLFTKFSIGFFSRQFKLKVGTFIHVPAIDSFPFEPNE